MEKSKNRKFVFKYETDATRIDPECSRFYFKLCIACNSKMPESCKACTCGHVFEDMKQIGGKRFSGYRAQLYTRLETKRMNYLTKLTKRNCEDLGSSDEENKHEKEMLKIRNNDKQVFRVNIQCEGKTTRGRKPVKRLHRSVSPSSMKQASTNRKEQNPVPAEIIDRLPKALAEINRRLLGQNLMWACL